MSLKNQKLATKPNIKNIELLMKNWKMYCLHLSYVNLYITVNIV